MKKLSKKRGFTVLELMLVMALVAITTGISLNYFNNSRVRADLNSTTEAFIARARTMKSSAASGLEDSDYGVHLESDRYTLFEGSSFNPADSKNFEVLLPPTVTIDNISVTSNPDIIFTAPYGDTSSSGTFDFTASSISMSWTISVNSLGMVSKN